MAYMSENASEVPPTKLSLGFILGASLITFSGHMTAGRIASWFFPAGSWEKYVAMVVLCAVLSLPIVFAFGIAHRCRKAATATHG
jgi:hypothetical protein